MAGQTGPTGPTGANGANGSTGPTGSAASNYTATAAVAATDNNGIIINNTTHQIKLEFADATHNGIVSTTTQDFNGVKIFLTEVQTPIVTNPNDTIRIASTATQYPIGPGALVGVVTGTGLVAIGDNAEGQVHKKAAPLRYFTFYTNIAAHHRN